jgi:hypothetical protein
VNFFPGSWTIVHPITDESPLFGMSQEELLEKHAEFLILIKGQKIPLIRPFILVAHIMPKRWYLDKSLFQCLAK